MIAYLKGNILSTNMRGIILDVSGVGYKIETTPQTALSFNEGQEASFFIHTVVRADALELFGFMDQSELQLFQKLITVSGVGPRSGLNILGSVDEKTLITAVTQQDATYLTKISGIGKKIAGKIVLELKDAFETMYESHETHIAEHDRDVIDALCALGYNQGQARKALSSIDPSITGVSARITASLQIIT
jgi:Holliday junction DNA helicase RuvA